MKTVSIAFAASALVALAGCASTAASSTAAIPAGMKAGQFVDFGCEGGKKMSARAAADGSTVRVRYEGGWELDRKPDGSFEAEGWKLTNTDGTADLTHNGKVVLKGCKPA
jgi:hypothetical protein